MSISTGDLIRHIITGAVVLIIAILGLKAWNKIKLEKQIVGELRHLADPTTSFESHSAEDAESALFKSIALLHQAEAELGKEPVEILKKVFHGNDDGALFGKAETGRNASPDPREEVIRKGLLRNYQHCRTLGILSDGESRRALKEGTRPLVTKGPSSNSRVIIRYIIAPEISPGVEKLVPNMIISPSDLEEREQPTDLEITQAKELVRDLYNASLIEREAGDRLREHYEQINNPVEPPPSQEPVEEQPAQPEPEATPDPDSADEPEEVESCPFDQPLPDNL